MMFGYTETYEGQRRWLLTRGSSEETSLSDLTKIGNGYYNAIIHASEHPEETKEATQYSGPSDTDPRVTSFQVPDLEYLDTMLKTVLVQKWDSAVRATVATVSKWQPSNLIGAEAGKRYQDFSKEAELNRLLSAFQPPGSSQPCATANDLEADLQNMQQRTFVDFDGSDRQLMFLRDGVYEARPELTGWVIQAIRHAARSTQHFDMTLKGLYIPVTSKGTLRDLKLVGKKIEGREDQWKGVSRKDVSWKDEKKLSEDFMKANRLPEGSKEDNNLFDALLATLEGQLLTYLLTDVGPGEGEPLISGKLEMIFFNLQQKQMAFRFSSSKCVEEDMTAEN